MNDNCRVLINGWQNYILNMRLREEPQEVLSRGGIVFGRKMKCCSALESLVGATHTCINLNVGCSPEASLISVPSSHVLGQIRQEPQRHPQGNLCLLLLHLLVDAVGRLLQPFLPQRRAGALEGLLSKAAGKQREWHVWK